MIEATRLQSTPKPAWALDEELQDEDFGQRPQPQSIGLALVTERKMGSPALLSDLFRDPLGRKVF